MGKVHDLTGLKFGRLTVIGRSKRDYISPSGKTKKPLWICQCDCGGITTVQGGALLNGGTKSCGCLQKELAAEHIKNITNRELDIAGKIFGRLTAIQPIRKDSQGVIWLCKCECGNEIEATVKCLRSGNTKSCGCLRDDKIAVLNAKHSKSHTRLYNVWVGMRQRCNDKDHKSYQNYGGRGIKVCDKWNDFTEFERWALSSGYDENAEYGECTIDRIDVNGNYEPDNCRWATAKEQANNKR